MPEGAKQHDNRTVAQLTQTKSWEKSDVTQSDAWSKHSKPIVCRIPLDLVKAESAPRNTVFHSSVHHIHKN